MAKKSKKQSGAWFSMRSFSYFLILLVIGGISFIWLAPRMGYKLPDRVQKPVNHVLNATERLVDSFEYEAPLAEGLDHSASSQQQVKQQSDGIARVPVGPTPPQEHVQQGSWEWEQYVYGGLPVNHKPARQLKILANDGFVVAYNDEKKNPSWVAYRADRQMNFENLKRPSMFKVDQRTNAMVRHQDYTHSGFDRGHMAPNYLIDTRYGKDAQLETFLMSNIVPQKPRLNRYLWMRLEQAVAKSYAPRYENIWVITGPIYAPNPKRLKNGTAVPVAFYKILIDEVNRKPRALAFIMPQEVTGKEKFEEYLTSIDEIERQVRYDFLPQLPDQVEDKLEANLPVYAWPTTYNR